MISTLLSAAFLAASFQDAPLSTSPEAPRLQPVAPSVASVEPPVPEGAPRDDYGLVAWCHGSLSGHMELARRLQALIPLDDRQQTIGAQDLRRYDTALAASPQSTTARGAALASQERAAGLARWTPVQAMTPKDQEEKYLSWSLPGRCDHAAARLLGSSDILGAAFRTGVNPAAPAAVVATEVPEVPPNVQPDPSTQP